MHQGIQFPHHSTTVDISKHASILRQGTMKAATGDQLLTSGEIFSTILKFPWNTWQTSIVICLLERLSLSIIQKKSC